jgi:hypothetical protein
MAVGDIIYAADIATLRTTLNTILNGNSVASGYNQGTSIAANPSVGSVIDDAYHDSVYAATGILTNYYNIGNPFVAVNAPGLVYFNDYASEVAALNSTLNIRHSAPWTYSAGWDTTTATELTSAVSNWNGSKTFDFNIAFSSTAHMNSWFTAGGEIRISASHSSSATPQAISWQQLCTELGTFRISVRPTDTTDTNLSVRKLYNDLTGAYTNIKLIYADATSYATNYIQIQAYKTTTNVYVRMIINDAHTNTWSDIVSGTTTATVSSLKLSNAVGSVNITNPTFTSTAVFV